MRRRPWRTGLGAAGILLAGLLVTGCGTVPTSTAPTGSGSSPSAPGTPAGTPGPSGSASGGSAAGGGKQCTYRASGTAAKPVQLPPSTDVPDTGSVRYAIRTNVGTITVVMDRSQTPCTINSFASLARQRYFDDTSCHRLTTSGGLFVLQCGDPTGTGSGGPGYQFPDELDGSETYPAGTVAMANAGPNTNGSQFFLVYRDSTLPPNYTVFGSMDQTGLSVVQKIAAAGEDDSNGAGDGKPKSPVQIIGVAQV